LQKVGGLGFSTLVGAWAVDTWSGSMYLKWYAAGRSMFVGVGRE
jgi:hypothetical protein